MMFLYNILVYILLPVAWVVLAKKYDNEYVVSRQKFSVEGEFDFIIHAASVGEQNLIVPLVEELSGKGFKILLTAATKTGLNKAVERFSDYGNISVSYFPLDFKHSVKRFFSGLKAKKMVLVETELWPNAICEAYNKGMELYIVNGRISNKSLKFYKAGSFFLSKLFGMFKKIIVRSEEDGKRFSEIGCPKNKVKICGNLKLSAPPKVSCSITIKSDSPVMVFGSTRDGEEEIIVEYMEDLMKEGKIAPVFVPRHTDRCENIKSYLENRGFQVVLSNEKSEFVLEKGSILLVNETGKLVSYYNAAELCYVGGSLVDKGGQNFAEPLFLGKPTVCGPYLDNFSDIKEILFDYFYIAENGRELRFFVENFLENPKIFKEKGEKAVKTISENVGSLNCVLKELL